MKRAVRWLAILLVGMVLPAYFLFYPSSPVYKWSFESFPGSVLAQLSIELPCPSGYSGVVGPTSITRNPVTDSVRYNFCIDSSGHMFYQGDGLFGTKAVYAMQYNVMARGHKIWGVTYSSGNCTITSSFPVFQQSDVGSLDFATNVGAGGNGSQVGAVIIIPLGKIVSVTDSTHAIVSVCPTGNVVGGSDSFVYGIDEGIALNTAWHAAADACNILVLPAGTILTSRGQFNYANENCLVGVGADRIAQGVKGQGAQATHIVMTPSFDFTTGAGNSCDGYFGAGVNVGCFFSVHDGMYASDMTLDGAGLNITSAGSVRLITANYQNGVLRDMNLMSFQASANGTNIAGLSSQCAFCIFDNLQVDGWGGQNCSITGGNAPGATNPARLSNSFCGDGGQVGLMVSGHVQSVNNYLGLNQQIGVWVFGGTGTLFESTNDLFDARSTTKAALYMSVAGAIANIENGHINQESSYDAIRLDAASTVNLSRTWVNSVNGISLHINASGGVISDNCGNKITGNTLVSVVAGGVLSGTCSTSGTLLVAGNVVLSAGWGTTASVSAPLGESRAFRFTVTSSGTGQAANPTMTITFPTPFLIAPPAMDCKMVGGTGTQTAVNGESTATATTLTETFSGTPVAASNYIISCATP